MLGMEPKKKTVSDHLFTLPRVDGVSSVEIFTISSEQETIDSQLAHSQFNFENVYYHNLYLLSSNE